MFRLLVFSPIALVAALFATVHFQKRFIYNNWGPQPRFIWKSAIDVEEVHFKTKDGETLRGYWCDHYSLDDWKLPTKPVVLFCHGNSSTIDQWRWIIDRWTWMIGADVLIFDYRGYGASTGSPCEDGLYTDARAAYDWLVREKKIEPNRMIIVGQSLGGGVAVQLASEVDHKMLVLESTFTSMCDVVDGVFCGAPLGFFCSEKFPNVERLRKYKKPVFLSHGDRDRLVPHRHSDQLLKALGESGNKSAVLWTCPNMGHNDRRDWESYASLLREFLAEHW